MAQTPRDLSRPELWASSIERSLERRRRPRRSSTELWALREPRDLTDALVFTDSLQRAVARRSAAERSAGMSPGAVRGLSLLGVLAATATPTAAAVAAADGSGTGSTNTSLPDPESVGALQRQLGVPADGHFGARTDLAVRQFQNHRGLFRDGVVGPATRTALGLSAGPQLREAGVGAGPRAATATASTVLSADPVPQSGGVVALQARLGVSVDGDFGPITAAAVRHLQVQRGLNADGVVGPATRLALGLGAGAQLTESPRYMPISAPGRGLPARSARVVAAPARDHAASPGGSVGALQSVLGLSADGDFGPRTAAAVRAYQRAHGLAPDGVVGPSTRAAMGLRAGPALRLPVPALGANPRTSGNSSPATRSTVSSASSPSSTSSSSSNSAAASASPSGVGAMTAAGDRIATTPYVYGGGHGSFSANGYDCSGSVSYVLHGAGLLSSPEDSGALESYGQPGPGRHVTIYANAGHAWMTIDGRRYDTSGLSARGSRWSSSPGDASGYVVRHPAGM